MSLTSFSNQVIQITEQVLKAPISNNSMPSQFKIIIGSVSGLILAIILICALVYAFKRYKSTRNHRLSCNNENEEHMEDFNFEANANNEITSFANKASSFKVLLIYTYDCEEHFNVIKAFSHFLREICKLTVYFDYWDNEEIKSIGVEAWLDKYLETCNYVLIIWSIGARIKCSSKLNNQSMPIYDDYLAAGEGNNKNLNFSKLINDLLFNYSVNYILKAAKTKQNDDDDSDDLSSSSKQLNNKYLNVYFDYSNKNDISYKFDSFKQYWLMFDIKSFLQHIFLTQNFSVISSYLGINVDEKESNRVKLLREKAPSNERKGRKIFSAEHQQNEGLLESDEFNQNLTGLKLIYIDQLYKQLNNTKNYFKLNPNWFENSLFKNNSTLSLDSCLLSFENNFDSGSKKKNLNKLISISSKSSLETIPRRNLTPPSSPSLISFNSNFNLANNNAYNDFFLHPLPSSIDLNYFNSIEEKQLNSNNSNNNDDNHFLIKNINFVSS